MRVYIVIVFAYFIVFTLFNAWLLVMAAVALRRHFAEVAVASIRRTVRSPLAPPISILVPAFNEEAGIVDSVRSLLALEYPNFEVVIVSDGSTDRTVEVLVEAFDLQRAERPTPPFLSHAEVHAVYVPRGRLRMIVLDKDNSGKGDSLNAGMNFARYPLVCSIDADSILEQDALIRAAMPFIDDPVTTMATGGVVRIANGCRIERGRLVEARLPSPALPMFQVVEYLRAFFAARTGWTAVNGLLIVSGAFGLFRKEAAIAVGGYRVGSVGEDMELVVRIHRRMREQRRRCRVVYVPDPVCWTEAPESLGVLRRQRRRWHRGSVETLFTHRRVLFNPRYGTVGLLAMPELLLFEILGPVVELSGYIVVAIAFATGVVDGSIFLLFLALAVLYGLVLSFGAVAIEDAAFGRHPGWDQLGRVLLFAAIENFGYRQLLLLWRMEGFWQVIRRGEWGAMERKGLARDTTGEQPLHEQVGLR
jgi:cellulose synthase/poly-beta-1,6-N-acetylglucosamine synthase-like glycosyltransferase